ncbi:putative dehydrogenase [Kribbella amoyensis]|uniref:Putative dehydrogenase n=1 Tax=Kribbella amoyensis TaxID=996641 RepID=A0A561AZM9_9ACTN|nr:Gfo/Idh/MocA family oxidoreductase [Kribbella amoyensis]TWD72042.1 putative dehydrogenase [Kribbella amoyensis]
MTGQPLAVAIIGCGVIGKTHTNAVLTLPRLRLAALIDVDTTRADGLADQTAEKAGTRPAVYSSLADALDGPDKIDLVVVATPSGLHVEHATEALEGGAHVLIEKPLDVDARRGTALARLAEKAAALGQVASVISQHRFDPASEIVRRAIEAGDFGRITSAMASVPWWRSQGYYDSGDWRGTWELDGGGALMNQGVHTLDLLLWFLGRPVTVSAEFGLLAHQGIEVEDIVTATLRFESGALAVLHATTSAYPGLAVRLQVHGDRGSAVIEGDKLEYFHAAQDSGGADMGLQGGGNQAAQFTDATTSAGVDATQFTDGHVRQYVDLLAAIDENRPPAVTVDDALVALATVRAVYVSATTGGKVTLDDVIAGKYDEVRGQLPD